MKKMKQVVSALAMAGAITITSAFAPEETKLIAKTGHVSFFSHTDVEDISANSYQVSSTLEETSGAVVFIIPMQSFEFEKAAMQKHYNSPKFLDTQQFPKAKFKGVITNLSEIDFAKDGVYNASVKGDLTMHGVTKPVTDEGTITVKGGEVQVDTKLDLVLADYDVAFEKGKPSSNIAKTVTVTVKIAYKK